MTSKTTDSWCTPKWIADLLGRFEIDVASNHASHIQAETHCVLGKLNGLNHDWRRGSVFCNPPYSNVVPWAIKLRDHDAPWCALLKLDPSTKWWAALMEASPTVAPFRKRIKFEGDRSMTANFPSVLVYSAWRPSRELAAHLWLPTFVTHPAPVGATV